MESLLLLIVLLFWIKSFNHTLYLPNYKHFPHFFVHETVYTYPFRSVCKDLCLCLFKESIEGVIYLRIISKSGLVKRLVSDRQRIWPFCKRWTLIWGHNLSLSLLKPGPWLNNVRGKITLSLRSRHFSLTFI